MRLGLPPGTYPVAGLAIVAALRSGLWINAIIAKFLAAIAEKLLTPVTGPSAPAPSRAHVLSGLRKRFDVFRIAVRTVTQACFRQWVIQSQDR